MIDWLIGTMPLFKALHIAGLTIWCAGLMALPFMLSRHHPDVLPDDYDMMRRASHITYTMCVTPAAVIAVIAGTWLIFMQQAFVPWLYAKLAFVALLVAAHAWIGHILVQIAEEPEESTPPKSYLTLTAVAVPILAILFLVLAKPPMGWAVIPDWLMEPRGGQLPFDVPSR